MKERGIREGRLHKSANDGLRERKAGPIPAKNRYRRTRVNRETRELIQDSEEEEDM